MAALAVRRVLFALSPLRRVPAGLLACARPAFLLSPGGDRMTAPAQTSAHR